MEKGTRDERQKVASKSIRDDVREFGDNTTLQGVRFVTGSDIHCLRRSLWAIFLCCLYVWLFIELYVGLGKFFRYPVATGIIVNHVSEVVFPAVTLCNQNTLRQDNIEKHRLLLELLEASINDDAVIHWDLYDNVTEGYTWNLTQWAFEGGHQIEDMLLECKWKLHDHCSADDFVSVVTDFGVCYTFNADEYQPLLVGHAGSAYGLTLIMDIEQDQYSFSEFGGAGLKIFLHPQGELPLVKMHGFSVAPGLESDITLKYVVRKNLPSPYKPYCFDKHLKYSHIYNAELCRYECEVDAIIDECGCKYYNHPGDAPVCDPKQVITCVMKVLEQFVNWSPSECVCPEPCNQAVYESKVSIARWPSNYYEKILSEKYNKSGKYISDNFLELNIYFEEVRTEEIRGIPSYDAFSLLGNVGGYLGLLCGASLITVVEIADCVLMRICRRF